MIIEIPYEVDCVVWGLKNGYHFRRKGLFSTDQLRLTESDDICSIFAESGSDESRKNAVDVNDLDNLHDENFFRAR